MKLIFICKEMLISLVDGNFLGLGKKKRKISFYIQLLYRPNVFREIERKIQNSIFFGQ